MAEVGFVKCAPGALRVGQAVLPASHSKCSKPRCQQPQLLAILGLMRDEDWTFRAAEVRLAEHAALRAALGLQHVPDSTPMYRFLRRLDASVREQIVSATVQRRGPPPDHHATVAVDATGLAPGAVSTCFVKRAQDRGAGLTWRHWRQWSRAVDVDRRLMIAPRARRGPTNDCATLRPLVAAAHQRVAIGLVLADAEFDSERHHPYIRMALQAHSIMPAERGRADWRIQGVRAQMRQGCPRHAYSQRSLIERVISAVKRKRSARAPGRSLQTQCLQALRLGIADDIYRLLVRLLAALRRVSTEPDDF